jgi:hypothetical protein
MKGQTFVDASIEIELRLLEMSEAASTSWMIPGVFIVKF